MKIFRLFTIAAAALILSACSEDIAQMINGGKKEFTATLAAPNKGGTRTVYTEDTQNNKIAVAWKVGDEIALVHNGVKDVVKVKTVNADGSATINGTITGNVSDGNDVKLVYPAAYVGTVTGGDGYGYEPNPDIEKKLLEQDGTLAYIQDNIDFREDMNTLSVKESVVTLTKSADMSSSIAIWKLTLLDSNEAELKATQVKIKSGGNDLASTAVLTTGKSTLYLAVPVVLEQTITIEATVGEDTYSFTKNVTLNASAYYQSTVTMAKIVDLSTVTTATTIKNGYTVTGTLDVANHPVQISIAAGATVTLDGVTIKGENNDNYKWAGITCLGDATIILKDGTENTVQGFYLYYPGIHPAEGKTLTIKGTGSLDASSNGNGAGIGGGNGIACGNIKIEGGTVTATGGKGAAGIGSGGNGANCGTITISGGTVTATGGNGAAGIGSGGDGSCGTITISGGTVTATGRKYGAGIGSGDSGRCGNITITKDVTSVKATKGSGATNSIGAGDSGTCGTVTIGCTLDTDGHPVGGTTGAITQSPYEYPPIAATAHELSASVVGDVVGSNGKAYTLDATHVLPSGVTAVAMVAYKSATAGESLAIQLNASPSKMDWKEAAYSYTSYPSITGNLGTWRLPSKADWQNMFVGCAKSGDAGAGDTMKPIDGFKEKIGATGITWNWNPAYWSSTDSGMNALCVDMWLSDGSAGATFSEAPMTYELQVLGCLAF